MPATRIPTLDGLRGIAILMVLMVHLVVYGAVPSAPLFVRHIRTLMWCGWSGVDLFFVLSGFLITGILIDARREPRYFANFYMRRVLRIFPAYYFMVFLVMCIAPLLALKQPWIMNAYPSFPGWLSLLFYYPNWWFPIKEPGHAIALSHFWSLGIEEQFYLLWPACVRFTSPGRLGWLCAAGAAFSLALRVLLLHPGLGPAVVLASTRYGSPIILMNTLTRLDTLLIGAFVAVAIRNPKPLELVREVQPYVFVVSLAGIAMIGVFGHEIWSRAYFTQTIGFTLYACLYASILLWAFLQSGRRTLLDRFLSAKPLRQLGKYSYGTYIFHEAVYICLSRSLSRYSWYGKSVLPSFLACGAFLILSVGAAVISFHFLESPFLRIKTRFQNRKPNPVSSHIAVAS